jgi:hypothetical protein
MLRRILITLVAATAVILCGATGASAGTKDRVGIQASCWVNTFAWVSTSPSNQGNLSSIVSCNTTVSRISQTMYVHDYYTNAIVATVPADAFNTTSGGVAYHWYCSSISPHAYWGEVRATVTEYNGFVSNGSWGTQVLSC